MNNDNGSIDFEAYLRLEKLEEGVKKMEKMLNDSMKSSQKETDKLQQSINNLTKGAMAFFTISKAYEFSQKIIAVRSQFQQLEIAFGTMLKSKEKANALMAQMTDLAAKTPFRLQEVSEGAKRLLAFQVPAQEVTETLRRMGDVAAGLGVPIERLIHVYGQVKAQGRMFTNDLYQFMNAGIPMISELSKAVGKSETEIKEMVSEGKIGFAEVQAVIKNMTNEGGTFYNLMDAQSKSLGGQISNLKDNFAQVLNEIGKATEGIASGAISSVSFLVENYQTLGKIIAGLIATYGAYRTAVLVNIALTKGWAVAAKEDAIAKGIQTIATNAATAATKALNAAMKANPYVLVATAVVGLGAAIWALKDNTTAAEKAQQDYNNQKQQAIDWEQQHKQKIDDLIESATNQALADTERQKALIALQNEYPNIFAKYDIESLKLADILKLKQEIAQYDANEKRLNRANEYGKYQDFEKALNKAKTGKSTYDVNKLKNSILDEEMTRVFGKSWIHNIDEVEKYIREKQKITKNDYKGDRVAAWSMEVKNLSEDEIKKELEHRQKLIADLQKQKKAGNKWASHGVNFGGDWFAFNEEELQAQSKTLQAQLDKLHEQTYEYKDLTKKYTQAVKDAEVALDTIKNGGKGKHTEEEFAKIIKEAEDNLKNAKKTLEDHKTSLSKSKGAKAAKTKTELPTFDYKKAAQEEARREQDFLFQKEQARINIMEDGAKKRLAIIQLDYDRQEEEIRRRTEDQMAAFIEQQKAQAEAEGKWKKGQAFNEDTPEINAHRAKLQTEEQQLLASNHDYMLYQQEQVYKELLEKYQTYTEKRKNLVQKHEKELKELSKTLSDEQLEELKKQQTNELNELDDAFVSKKDNYKKLFEDLRELSNKEIEEAIKEAKKLLLITNMSDEMRKSINARIKDTERMFSQKKLSEINQYSQAVRELSKAFSELGSSTGNSSLSSLGAAIGNIAGQFTGLMEVMNKYKNGNISSADKVGAVAGFASNLISSIADSARQRKEAEEQYYNSVISYQNAYNLALIEQKRIQKELDSSFLLKDRTEQLKHEFDTIRDVGKQQEKQLELIRSKGQMKVGTGSKTDWGGVAGITAGGAVTGAMIGGPIGAAVGAVAGFIGGLFSSKKPKDVFGNLLENWPHLLKQSANGVWEIDRATAESAKNSGLVNEETKLMLQQYIDLQDELEKSRTKIKEIVTEFAGNLAPNIQNSLVEAFKAGENAIVKMGETMDKVVENMVASLIFQSIFKDTFKKLEDEMQKSKDVGGDGNWVDDFGRFYREAGAKTKQYYDALAQARDSAKTEGFNILQDNTQRQAVEKGFARISQDSADELNGQFRLQTQLSAEIKNAMLQSVKEFTEMHKFMQISFAQQLKHLAGIEANTYKLHKIETDMAGVKTILGNIETKGIKMRT
jgi:tape measure domain protein